MKLCIACGSSYPSSSQLCMVCGDTPQQSEGFTSYAPELANTEEGFKSEFYSEYAHLEESHFWFRTRSQLIIWALQKYCPDLHSFFEVGCGTGYVLANIASAFPAAELCGSEMFTSGLRFAAARLPAVEFIQIDARHIPYVDEFDVVGAFDVLEHIEEDASVLTEMSRALKSDGVMLLTVPQHSWLWSEVDVHSCHIRRYSASELHRKVEHAGFTILFSTSFVSTLLPAMIASRALRMKRASDSATSATAELSLPSIMNKCFYLLLRLELFIVKLGGSFPVGGSRLVVAKKK